MKKLETVLSLDVPPEYSEFWCLWHQQKYFDCHEVLEALWRRESGVDKSFYQGLIHCAVALYQVQRKNAVGASRQLVRARHRLAAFAPEYSGVPIEALLSSVEKEVAPLRETLSTWQQNDLKKLADQLKRNAER